MPSTKAPTTEPTPTATPTEVLVEVPAVEVQEWWLGYWDEMVKAAARLEDCEISYEIINARELGIVNAIPWTVDQNGETVQGVIPHLCEEPSGDGTYYWAFGSREEYGYYADVASTGGYAEFSVGPKHVGLRYCIAQQVRAELLGGLGQESFEQLQGVFSRSRPMMLVAAPQRFLKAITAFGFGNC